MVKACGGCAARRARLGITTKFVWTSNDGMQTEVYDKQVEAKAKVARRGGSYVPKDIAQHQ